VYKIGFALGSLDAVDAWKATRNHDDREFFDSMTALRHSEVHNKGATISREQEAIPMLPSYEERYSVRFAALVASRMLGSTEVYIDRHYVDLEDERVQAVPACERFVALRRPTVGERCGRPRRQARRTAHSARCRAARLWLVFLTSPSRWGRNVSGGLGAAPRV
jgi:hypothetical protein